jgi:hypothetical protein
MYVVLFPHLPTRAPPPKIRYIWASGADGAFSVSEDDGENEDLGRGTLIKIHLKEGEEVCASGAGGRGGGVLLEDGGCPCVAPDGVCVWGGGVA